MGLDVRVLRDDNTEVEIMETVDMGETDFRSLIEGDRKYHQEDDLGQKATRNRNSRGRTCGCGRRAGRGRLRD